LRQAESNYDILHIEIHTIRERMIIGSVSYRNRYWVYRVTVYFRCATIDLMLIQQNKFCWISDRSMVAHLK